MNDNIRNISLCTIHAESYVSSYDVWKYIKMLPKECDFDEYDLSNITNIQNKIRRIYPDDNTIENVVKTGYGIFVKYLDDIYIVTCHHIVNNLRGSIYGYVDIFDNKFNLKVVGYMKEIDLVVLKPIDLLNIAKYNVVSTDIDFVGVTIPYIIKNKENIKLKYHKVNKADKKFVSSEYDTNLLNIENSYFKSILIPKFPLIKFTCPTIHNDLELDGLSGTLLYIDNMIIGMTFCYVHNYLEAVPWYFIKMFTKHIIDSNEIDNKICGYSIMTELGDVDIEYKQYTVHYVTSDSVLSYKTHGDSYFKFKRGYALLKINNNVFTSEGKIHVELLNYDVLFDTYMMICAIINKNINITYIKVDNEEIKQVLLIPKNICLRYNVNIVSDHKYVYWRGFIFCELSEELIMTLNTINIKLIGNIFDNYKNYISERNKYVVIIDVNYKAMSDRMKSEVTNICLPYIRSDNGYRLLVVDKIGKKKINNLKHLKEIIELVSDNKKSKTSMTCYMDTNLKTYKIVM